VVAVPVDGLGDLPVAQLLERLALAKVALADVLVEDVDSWTVPVDEGFKPAAGLDGVELVVVTDYQSLRAGNVHGGEELEHGLVVSHACFID
jgi:hypothetical protein